MAPLWYSGPWRCARLDVSVGPLATLGADLRDDASDRPFDGSSRVAVSVQRAATDTVGIAGGAVLCLP